MKKFNKYLGYIENITGYILLTISCLAVLTQLVSREIGGKSLIFTEEIAKFSYIWLVYICIALGEHNREHFYVDIFVKFVKGKANLVLYTVEYLAGCLVFAYLFYWSIKFYAFEKVILSPALEMSMSVVALAVVVGIGLSLIHRTFKLVETINQIIHYSAERTVEN